MALIEFSKKQFEWEIEALNEKMEKNYKGDWQIYKQKTMTINEKIPSQFNGTLYKQPSTNNIISLNFINISLFNKSGKSCGRAENRTRNFQLTAECFTTELLAHNRSEMISNYLNIFNSTSIKWH